MMSSFYPIQIHSPQYRLSVFDTPRHWSIRGKIINAPFTTEKLPHTYSLLRKYIPRILTASCFNDKHLPFSQELRNTEIGHLLEHILLEFLCEEKLENGASEAIFDGITRWYKDSPEKFEIVIQKQFADSQYLSRALPRTLYVFNAIIYSPSIINKASEVSSDSNFYRQPFIYNNEHSRIAVE